MPDNTNTGGMPDSGQQQGGTPAAESQQQAPLTFDSWVAEQSDEVKALLDGHTKGLKSALESERAQRSDLAKQVRDLAAKAEKGSEMEKTLTDLQGKLEAEQKRVAFLEDAGRPEIGCSNPKAAYLIAQADGLFDRHGQPDWAAIKAAAPELFGRRMPQVNAGAGTGSPPQPAPSMNEFIRRMAGK